SCFVMPTQASSVISVQTGEILTEHSPLSNLPEGSLVLHDNEVGRLERQTRTLTCEQLHGPDRIGMRVEGGPVQENRYETGFERNEQGQIVLDDKGKPVKSYSTWLRVSGQCLRHHN